MKGRINDRLCDWQGTSAPAVLGAALALLEFTQVDCRIPSGLLSWEMHQCWKKLSLVLPDIP